MEVTTKQINKISHCSVGTIASNKVKMTPNEAKKVKNLFLKPLKSAIVPNNGARIETISVANELAYPQYAVDVAAEIPASVAADLKYKGKIAVTMTIE